MANGVIPWKSYGRRNPAVDGNHPICLGFNHPFGAGFLKNPQYEMEWRFI
jgi:hypothetical protein